MKNEKALEILSGLTVDYENRTPDEIAELDEALDMAINSLKCIASAPLHFSNKDYELGHTTGYKKGYTTGYKNGYKDAYLENQLSQSGTNDEDRTEDDQISRRAAVDAIFSEPLYESGMKKRDADAVVPAIYEKIKSLPSARPEVLVCGEGELIAQPEIIRCNDCKHWTQTTGNMRGFGLGDCDYINAKLVNCNGFCYWAERRTDG